MNIPSSDLPRVVIVGGGFAGMNVVKKLLKSQKFQIVLIDKRNYHTFQPLLYQVSTSGLEADSIAYPLRKLIKKGEDAFFRMATITSIDAENNTIHSNIGETTYDYLIVATGSKTNFFGNKSIEENAMWMKTIPQALNIRSLILENLEQATITKDPEERAALLNFVIAGAGPTGVELSGAIAEVRNNIVGEDYHDINASELHIHLLEGVDRVLPPMSEKASRKAKQFLEELGVEIHLNTMVESYDGEIVKIKGGNEFKTHTFIWSAGVTGSPIKGLKASAFIEKANRYNVNVFNQVEGYENVFAIGDIAVMQSEEWPKGYPQVAQPAIQQGEQLAANLKRILENEKLKPFKYKDKGTMATIGRNRAVVDLKHYSFGGFFAWFIWMFIHLWFLVGFRNRIVTFFNWTYSYINFDRAARLIIRPFKKNKVGLEDAD